MSDALENLKLLWKDVVSKPDTEEHDHYQIFWDRIEASPDFYMFKVCLISAFEFLYNQEKELEAKKQHLSEWIGDNGETVAAILTEAKLGNPPP